MSPRETNPLLPTTVLRSEDASAITPSYDASAKLHGEDDKPHKLLGIGCVAASAVCFSLMSTLLKFNTYSMTSMEAIFWRSLVALGLNYVFILWSGESLYVKAENRLTLFYRVLSGFSSISFAFYAVSQMVLADASVIIFTSPVITFFFIDPPSFFFAVLSFAGLICVVRPGFLFGYDHVTTGTDGSWIAIGSALLGAIGQAFVFISVRKLQGMNAFVIVHYFMVFSIVMALIWIAIFQRRFVIPDSWSLWASVIGSGVFTGVGQMLLTKGFQLEKAGIASVMRYLDVVCVFIWDAVLLGEKINHWSVIGAGIICSCAAVIALRKSRAK
uniref:EamA domain-containing protein n=1 Tax=Globisporangium ultimum (strain ATCC 200006 / CBS 805.95 / DAOM BR144) TaxID=431595 RepID=K3X108_GLOUD